MRITIELRRPARRSAALVLGALLLLTPAVVLASHQFPDVPDGHPFHDQISAIAQAGITAGFPDGGYHPSDPVTRQAMAAFMHRGFGRVALATGAPPMTPALTVPAGSPGNAAYTVPVRALTITVPGATNGFSPQQLVHLQGRVTFYTGMGAAKGCPCEFFAQIRDTSASGLSAAQFEMFESSSPNTSSFILDVEALLPASPGAHTYQIDVGLFSRATFDAAASYDFSSRSSLSAMTFPFGPTGTSDL